MLGENQRNYVLFVWSVNSSWTRGGHALRIRHKVSAKTGEQKGEGRDAESTLRRNKTVPRKEPLPRGHRPREKASNRPGTCCVSAKGKKNPQTNNGRITILR